MKTIKDLYTASIYGDPSLVDAVPAAAAGTTLEIFKTGKYLSADEVAAEYERRGLIPADPRMVADYSEQHKAEEHYIATQWKDAQGQYCYAAFGRGAGGDRSASVGRSAHGWGGRWSFAGSRKILGTSDTQSSAKHLDTLPFELPNELTINGALYRKVQ